VLEEINWFLVRNEKRRIIFIELMREAMAVDAVISIKVALGKADELQVFNVGIQQP
jgi:hypothetical protein